MSVANVLADMTPEALVAEARDKQPKGELDRLLNADVVVRRCDPRVLEAMGVMERALHLADSYEALDKMIDEPTLKRLARLMNSPLGFMCDKPNWKSTEIYSMPVVKRCIIEALLYGVMTIGNEFNIIAERCYVTRNGYTRKLNEYKGLTDLRIDFGVPKTVQKPGADEPTGAVVPVSATWMLNGVSDSIKAEIPIKMNKQMGLDAVIGKADRKIKYRVWCRITGSTFTPEGELDEEEIGAVTKPSANDVLAGAKAAAAAKTAPKVETPPEPAKANGTAHKPEPSKETVPPESAGDFNIDFAEP